MDNFNQLTRLDNTKIIEIILTIPNLTDEDKRELSMRVASDDIETRKIALEKITASQIAHHDLITIMGELTALKKEGMYIKATQTIYTGSGNFKIEIKGGDTKLIIPAMVIVGVVIISLLIIVFWR